MTALAQLEPSNMGELMKFSEWLSRSLLIPKPLQGKPADVAIVLMKGRDLGLSSMQALATINVIEGKPVMAAELIVALCKRHPEICESFQLIESTPEKATYEAKARGSKTPTRLTYTIQQATTAGLVGKDNWKRHPATMLRWRCSSALAKSEFPELTLGIITPDEAEEISDPPPTPRDITPPVSRTEEVKQLMKAQLVVDVPAGETEEQAVARVSQAPSDEPPADMFLPGQTPNGAMP